MLHRNRTSSAVRRRFNMVEIALALAVLSLGVSVILTMMPAGVSSGKQAIAENNLSDAASYVLGIYQAYIMETIHRVGTTSITLDSWKTALKLPDATYSNPDSDPRNVVKRADESSWNLINEDFAVGGVATNLIWYKESTADTYPKALQYQQKTIADSVETVEFAAVVRVWSGQSPTFKSRRWGSAGTAGFDDVPGGLRLFVELSWPVGVEYEEREKRVYTLDVYDPREDAGTRMHD